MTLRDKFKATRHVYNFADESGYRFQVVTEHDEEWGWNAFVTMSTHGMREAEGAVHALGDSARAFLRMLADDTKPTAGPASTTEGAP